MPKSLKARLNGSADEVVEYTRLWGWSKAMERYGIRSYQSFQNFIEDQTHDPNWGLRPVFGAETDRSWADDLLDAFTKKLARMEAEKESLKEENHRLQLELEYYKANQAIRLEPKVSQIMELCREVVP